MIRNLDSETHFNQNTPETFEFENFVIIQSSRNDKIRRQGVAIVIEKEWAKCISSYECTSERLMSVTFDTTDGPLTIFQIYAPDSSYKDEIYEEFFDTIQEKLMHCRE